MQEFEVQAVLQENDGIGGLKESWETVRTITGYLDMLSGSDLNNVQNAITEESTHILITMKHERFIDDSMRIIDKNNRSYAITYVDNPIGIDHHNEIYLTYSGDGNG